MAKVNVGRQGFLTKSALPTVSRNRNNNSQLLLLGSGSNGQTTFTDSSINNFAINRFGNTVISTATAPTGMTSSILFDGNGDYLTTTPSTAWNPGSQSFTLECYFYAAANVTSTQQLFGCWDGTNTNSFNLYVYNLNGVGFDFTTNGTYNPALSLFSGNSAFSINTWNHVALVRSGSSFALYINGTIRATLTNSSTIFSNPSSFKIGGNLNSQWFNGYLSNVRVTIGTALYNGNFTPPSLPMGASPPDSISGSSVLLLGNGTNGSTSITDSSPNNLTVTRFGSVAISTASFPTGMTSSILFNGTTDYLTVPTISLTGDFTIQWWMNLTAAQSNWDMVCGQGTSPGPYLAINAAGMEMQFGSLGSTVASTTQSFTAGTWYNVSVTRSGSTIRMFVDGTLKTVTNSTQSSTFTIVPIGTAFGTTSTYLFSGYISNFQVYNGRALYTASYTPPSLPVSASNVSPAQTTVSNAIYGAYQNY